jgi:amino acid transporter
VKARHTTSGEGQTLTGEIVNVADEQEPLYKKVRKKLLGKPLDVGEPSLFHKLSLIPLLAWIGLGADGLSSSSYGPDEAFRTIGSHLYLAIFLAMATAFTVAIIAYSYSRIIEHFPHGGGGYIVASRTLGSGVGVASGSALLVDYVLTITVSLASCGDAIFSFLPLHLHEFKLPFVICLVFLLVMLNLRGVKESITFLAPIFFTFVVTHIILIGYGLFSHTAAVGSLAGEVKGSLNQDLAAIGLIGIGSLFLRAFSLGAGTYTGIEAVSNGMQIMREPRVQTGKKTMMYMATSLAITAGGLLVCYYLFKIRPIEGQTMNAVLATTVFGSWPAGAIIALITLFSEGALLFVAAQAGFVDGPRVMSNMAIDSWLPRRFASLSERLTMQNGVLLMGAASLVLLLYTKGSVAALVIMYSINVFITFSLSQLGMIRFFIQRRKTEAKWKNHILVHIIGFIVCVTILSVTIYEKFLEGGWVTLLITSAVIALCYVIRRHYNKTRSAVQILETTLADIPSVSPFNSDPVNHKEPTAVLLVSGFNGFGLHTLLSVVRNFPNVYKNFIFVTVGEIDSGTFKGAEEINALKQSVKTSLEKYEKVARKHGFPADYRMSIGTDVTEAATALCEEVTKEFPRSTVFAGKLVFQRDNVFQRVLHNETAFAIQSRLQWLGIMTVILPIRVMK